MDRLQKMIDPEPSLIPALEKEAIPKNRQRAFDAGNIAEPGWNTILVSLIGNLT